MFRSKRLCMVLIAVSILILSSFAVSAASEFVGCWPYLVPPQGHFNTFATNYVSFGLYWDMIESPMALYYWGTDEWLTLNAVDWELIPEDNPDTYRIHLRQGVKWHDGTDFTSQDVLSTFYLGYLFNWAIWNYVDKVEAVDDYTVDFHMHRPSTVVLRYILRERLRAYSVYGDYYEELAGYLASGKDADSSEIKQLKVRFSQFQPPTMIGTGPYTFNPRDLTEAVAVMHRFDDYWAVDNMKFDAIRIYNGETAAITPLFLAKEAEYATHAFPPATEKQLQEIGVRIARLPLRTGPALFFNHDVYPLNRKEVRQAMAYAINRDEVAAVSLGASSVPQKYMAGVSDSLLPLWLDDETLA
ncbi:MAG: ABC transporter substrate-binding protein, partial [Firmicutes bacterium]|nr:ABC transporter substrate-binding protein [Bacillota bacterium]